MLDYLIDQTPTTLLDRPKKRPSNWLSALHNDHFKSSLTQYLVSTLDDNSLATTTGEK